jgi:hypothetical protein
MTKIKEIMNSISTPIIADLLSNDKDKSDKAFNIVLKAYNTYQDKNEDGVDYIFDANNIEDCKTLAKCGLTLKEYHNAVITSKIKSDYFFCGVNYPQVTFIEKENIILQLKCYLEDIIKFALINPYIEGYKELYNSYITQELNRILF